MEEQWLQVFFDMLIKKAKFLGGGDFAHRKHKRNLCKNVVYANFACVCAKFVVPLSPIPTLEGICPAESVSQRSSLGRCLTY